MNALNWTYLHFLCRFYEEIVVKYGAITDHSFREKFL